MNTPERKKENVLYDGWPDAAAEPREGSVPPRAVAVSRQLREKKRDQEESDDRFTEDRISPDQPPDEQPPDTNIPGGD